MIVFASHTIIFHSIVTLIQ